MCTAPGPRYVSHTRHVWDSRKEMPRPQAGGIHDYERRDFEGPHMTVNEACSKQIPAETIGKGSKKSFSTGLSRPMTNRITRHWNGRSHVLAWRHRSGRGSSESRSDTPFCPRASLESKPRQVTCRQYRTDWGSAIPQAGHRVPQIVCLDCRIPPSSESSSLVSPHEMDCSRGRSLLPSLRFGECVY